MPFRYHSSLAKLNFSSSTIYEVSALPLQPWPHLLESGFQFPGVGDGEEWGVGLLGLILTHTWPPLCHGLQGLWQVLQALRAVAGAVLGTGF